MTTLSEYLDQNSPDKELNQILNIVGEAAVKITEKIRFAPLNGSYGATEMQNASGEFQQKLDQMSNFELINPIHKLPSVQYFVSEEYEKPFGLSKDGRFVFYTDPLDGSSNIDVNVGVGTIFAVSETGNKTMIKGNEMVAAGYVLYSSAVMMVLTIGKGTHMFTLNENNEFILSNENVQIPEKGNIYSLNEGYSNLYSENLNNYLKEAKNTGMKLRYVGSMIADIHRTLLKGGIFIYPEDEKHPNGKLRLLYEVNPISMLVQQAGGTAITRGVNPLEIQAEETHHRVPVVMGSRKNVEDYLDLTKSV